MARGAGYGSKPGMPEGIGRVALSFVAELTQGRTRVGAQRIGVFGTMRVMTINAAAIAQWRVNHRFVLDLVATDALLTRRRNRLEAVQARVQIGMTIRALFRRHRPVYHLAAEQLAMAGAAGAIFCNDRRFGAHRACRGRLGHLGQRRSGYRHCADANAASESPSRRHAPPKQD